MEARDIINETMKRMPMSDLERRDILTALGVAEKWGYGNLVAWLTAEWATMLRVKHDFSAKAAKKAVSGRSPYSVNEEYFHNKETPHEH